MPRGRDGIPPHQSSARLPDLRPSRRVPSPRTIRPTRPRRLTLHRYEGEKTEKRRNRPAHPPRRRALHHVQPLHPLHGRSRCRSRPRLHPARHPHHPHRPSGPPAGLQLLAQHRRYLSRRRIDIQRLPLPNARLVPQGNSDHRHELRHRHQHHPLDTGK